MGMALILAGFVFPVTGIFPWSIMPYFIGGGLILAASTFVVSLVTDRSAQLLGDAAYGSSGDSTPYQAGYSHAESLALRGNYAAAIEAYQAAMTTHPGDPEPYLRIARIHRKELKQPEDAAYWYRKARREVALPAARDLGISRELVELYLASDDRPRAIPELARIIEKFPDTPEGAWAEGLMAELKAQGPGDAAAPPGPA